ncbi:MAG: hypothetical protein M1828_005533 [Chrysothrix sp. TS-e1954]|nr:MAG: hypothetical protein M1828_005533 [Chrysothrix sp. TS-e1954]
MALYNIKSLASVPLRSALDIGIEQLTIWERFEHATTRVVYDDGRYRHVSTKHLAWVERGDSAGASGGLLFGALKCLIICLGILMIFYAGHWNGRRAQERKTPVEARDNLASNKPLTSDKSFTNEQSVSGPTDLHAEPDVQGQGRDEVQGGTQHTQVGMHQPHGHQELSNQSEHLNNHREHQRDQDYHEQEHRARQEQPERPERPEQPERPVLPLQPEPSVLPEPPVLPELPVRAEQSDRGAGAGASHAVTKPTLFASKWADDEPLEPATLDTQPPPHSADNQPSMPHSDIPPSSEQPVTSQNAKSIESINLVAPQSAAANPHGLASRQASVQTDGAFTRQTFEEFSKSVRPSNPNSVQLSNARGYDHTQATAPVESIPPSEGFRPQIHPAGSSQGNSGRVGFQQAKPGAKKHCLFCANGGRGTHNTDSCFKQHRCQICGDVGHTEQKCKKRKFRCKTCDAGSHNTPMCPRTASDGGHDPAKFWNALHG